MKTADIQAYINCRDNRGVIVDQHDQEVYISICERGPRGLFYDPQ